MMALHSLMLNQGEEVDIEDINEEINAFLQRKHPSELLCENFECDASNWNEHIIALSEELSLLGIHLEKCSCVDENTIISLCKVIWTLLSRDRKLNNRAVSSEDSIKKIKQNNEILLKSNKRLTNEIQDMKAEMGSLYVTCNKLKSKIEDYTKEIAKHKTESEKLRRACKAMEITTKKEVNKIKGQMESLRNKFRGQCGTFVSKENIENEVMRGLKKKEVKYIEDISNLKQENDKLVHEILNMKEDIILLKYKQTKSPKNV